MATATWGGHPNNIYRPNGYHGRTGNGSSIGPMGIARLAGGVSVPFTFVPGTVADANQVNANFASLTGFLGSNTQTAITTPTTFFVAPNGSDTNDGSDPNSPAATITHVYNNLLANYRFAMFDVYGAFVTIQLAPGTYTENCILVGIVPGQKGPNNLIIQGDPANPSSVVITHPILPPFQCGQGAMFRLQGVTLTTPVNGSDCIYTQDGCFIQVQAVNFGPCQGAHIHVRQLSQVHTSGNYSITGGATTHFLSQNFGLLWCSLIVPFAQPPGTPPAVGPTITLVGNPNFSNSFAFAGGHSQVSCFGTVFVGTAQGVSGIARNLAWVFGQSIPLPGNQQYIADAPSFGLIS